jgi:hypothetical protein
VQPHVEATGERVIDAARRWRAWRGATRGARGALAAGLACCLMLAPSAAAAAPAAPDRLINIGVILDEPAIEIAVIEALDGRGYRVIRGTDLRARAAAEGIKPGLPPGTRALARSMGLSGIIGGVIRTQGARVTAFIVLSDGASGEIVSRGRWAAPSTQRLGATVRKEFWRTFGPGIRALIAVPGATTAPQPPASVTPYPEGPGSTAPAGQRTGAPVVPPPAVKPAPPPTPPPPATIPPGFAPTQGALPEFPSPRPSAEQAPPAGDGAALAAGESAEVSASGQEGDDGAEEVEEQEVPRSGRSRARRELPLLEMVLGMRLHSRSFDYDNDPDDALASYNAAVAPGVAGSLSFFPLRRWIPVGMQVAGESTARIASELPGELTYNSRNIEVQGAAVLELSSRWLVVQVAAGGGWHRFSFVPSESARSRPRPVPDVLYRYLRGGANLRVMVSPRFGIEAGAYYRHVLHPGEIRANDWFPRDKAFALELGTGVGYRLTRQLEARAEAHVRRYQHKLNVKAGDPRNAAGAVDQHISAGLSLAWAIGAGPLR